MFGDGPCPTAPRTDPACWKRRQVTTWGPHRGSSRVLPQATVSPPEVWWSPLVSRFLTDQSLLLSFASSPVLALTRYACFMVAVNMEARWHKLISSPPIKRRHGEANEKKEEEGGASKNSILQQETGWLENKIKSLCLDQTASQERPT